MGSEALTTLLEAILQIGIRIWSLRTGIKLDLSSVSPPRPTGLKVYWRPLACYLLLHCLAIFVRWLIQYSSEVLCVISARTTMGEELNLSLLCALLND